MRNCTHCRRPLDRGAAHYVTMHPKCFGAHKKAQELRLRTDLMNAQAEIRRLRQSRPPPQREQAGMSDLTAEELKFLLRNCHPERNQDDPETSTSLTRKIIAARKHQKENQR